MIVLDAVVAESPVFDLAFTLEGRRIAHDYADRLQRFLADALPGIVDRPNFGLHPLQGLTPEDETERIWLLSRRSRLILRLPSALCEAGVRLAGRELDLGAGLLRLGAAQKRPLTPASVLYSAFVHLGPAEEAPFLVAAERALAAHGIRPRLLPGKARHMLAEGRTLPGYSLMLHGLDEAQSLHVQTMGLGSHRAWGCGVFVPHKSIAAVGS